MYLNVNFFLFFLFFSILESRNLNRDYKLDHKFHKSLISDDNYIQKQNFELQNNLKNDKLKNQFYQFKVTKNLNKTLTNEDEEKIIRLISWRWSTLGYHFVISVFLVTAAVIKIIYHHIHAVNIYIPESVILIIIGIFFGSICEYFNLNTNDYLPKFDTKLFFYILLPPIILESAYSLYDHVFFNNIGTIMLYAVVGTLMNIFLLGPTLWLLNEFDIFGNDIKISIVNSFLFATLISAVDPVAVLTIFQEVNVNKALYFLVFGESLFNDAVVITIYNTMTVISNSEIIQLEQILLGCLSFFVVSVGGIACGIFIGGLSSLMTRFTSDVRVVEPLAVIAFSYLSYILAEMLHLSGIISLICCGLMQAEYTRHNISNKSYTTIKYLTKTLSSISDVIIFLFLGTVLIKNNHDWNWKFIFFCTSFCVIYRFITTFTLTYFANNLFGRVRLVNFEEQVILSYGGLRGGISFSLALMLNQNHIKETNLFITTTLFVILFTVFVLGSTTKPLMKLLRVKTQVKSEAKLFLEINKKLIDTTLFAFEEIADQRSFSNLWTQRWIKFNECFLKKVLVKNNQTSLVTKFERLYHKSKWGSCRHHHLAHENRKNSKKHNVFEQTSDTLKEKSDEINLKTIVIDKFAKNSLDEKLNNLSKQLRKKEKLRKKSGFQRQMSTPIQKIKVQKHKRTKSLSKCVSDNETYNIEKPSINKNSFSRSASRLFKNIVNLESIKRKENSLDENYSKVLHDAFNKSSYYHLSNNMEELNDDLNYNKTSDLNLDTYCSSSSYYSGSFSESDQSSISNKNNEN